LHDNDKRPLTGRARTFAQDDVIVTKTDLKGRITYANRVFLDISQLELEQAIGAPHCIIRHPEMPRCIFKLLWDRLKAEKEVFAYVVNRATSGDHYWVMAHVTPSYDAGGNIEGYHSSRRVPNGAVIDGTIRPLYEKLLAAETRHADRTAGMEAGAMLLDQVLKSFGQDYDRFIFSL
jgi:PAS domain S-box-containing protein